MEERERARTGIASLKVRYNRVFGYYIEISKSNLHAVPADYHRKQTIAGGERFITPALKEYEEKVLGADERILERELEIFERAARARSPPKRRASRRPRARWPRSTCWRRSPRRAAVNNYIKPHVHDGDELTVVDARHPVVERRTAAAGEPFVPNDITLNGTTCQLVILTGPEHGRQVDLPAADRAALRDGAGRLVRAGARSEDRRSSTASSRASARRTTSRAASRRSWSRCRRPPTSCTPRPRAAWSCSTRSAAARRPSTA